MQKLNTMDTTDSQPWQGQAGRPLYPANGNDRIYAPSELAQDIVVRGWFGSPQRTRLPSPLWSPDGRKMRLTPTTKVMPTKKLSNLA
jgi:hypothetical protein